MEAKDSFSLIWCEKHKNWYQYNCPDCMVDANEADIKQAGIKEVVGQINPQIESFIQSPRMPNEMSLCIKVWWQAKLKEWGIE